jgi:hypothetical protein
MLAVWPAGEFDGRTFEVVDRAYFDGIVAQDGHVFADTFGFKHAALRWQPACRFAGILPTGRQRSAEVH